MESAGILAQPISLRDRLEKIVSNIGAHHTFERQEPGIEHEVEDDGENDWVDGHRGVDEDNSSSIDEDMSSDLGVSIGDGLEDDVFLMEVRRDDSKRAWAEVNCVPHADDTT